MKTYQTAEIAAKIQIHPNTVRRYEQLQLIPKPERQANGYRIFTEFHVEQFRLARLAFQIEVLQNGLRKNIVAMVKTAAAGEFDQAISLALQYRKLVQQEYANAEEAIKIVTQILGGKKVETTHCYKRKEVSDALHISVDTLRNWEMNGLLTIKRKQNGYRVYTGEDLRRLTVIRALRCANYSLEAILRMLGQLSKNPNTDIKLALNTPAKNAEIIAVCDKLITSLLAAEHNTQIMIGLLQQMKIKFS